MGRYRRVPGLRGRCVSLNAFEEVEFDPTVVRRRPNVRSDATRQIGGVSGVWIAEMTLHDVAVAKVSWWRRTRQIMAMVRRWHCVLGISKVVETRQA
jgi:hypothetical protein